MPRCMIVEPAAGGPTLVFQDEFTDSDATPIASHTPTTAGTGWTQEFNSDANRRIGINSNQAGKLAGGVGGNLRSWASAQPNPSGANQRVEAVVILPTGASTVDDPVILLLRASSGDILAGTSGTAYAFVVYSATQNVGQFYKIVSGTVTQLGANVTGIVSGDKVTFDVNSSTLSLYVNDILITTRSDSAITQTGRWGIGMGGIIVTSDDIDGQKFDDFKAWDL